MLRRIIDISNYQQKGTLDFKRLKAAGVQGVILRAGFGRFEHQKDKSFESHYFSAKAAGLPVGAYLYSYAMSVEQAKEEAAMFLNWIYDKQFELPVYYDIEDARQEKLGKRVCTDMAIAFCTALENAGYFAGVYANTNWFTNYLYREALRRFTQWEANYSKNPNKGADIWQYSESEHFDGYKGKLDANECYREFPELIKRLGLNGFDKPTEKPDYSTYIPGDVDGDGRVTAADARLVLRASAKLVALTGEQLLRADLNGDGELTAAEARTILRISAGLEPELEPKRR